MRLRDRISFNRRKGLSQEKIDELIELVNIEDLYSTSNAENNNAASYFYSYVLNNDRGMTKQQIIDNIDSIAELFNKMDNEDVKRVLYRMDLPDDIQVLIFTKALEKISVKENDVMNKHNDAYTNDYVRKVVDVIQRTGLPFETKLKVLEDNFENFSKNKVFLASIMNAMNTRYVQSQLNRQHNNGVMVPKIGSSKLETRVKVLTTSARDLIENGSYAHSLAKKSYSVRSSGYNFEIGPDDKELKAKLDFINDSMHFIEWPNYLNNKDLLTKLPTDKIIRLLLDENITNRMAMVYDDPNRMSIIKNMFDRPYFVEELPDLLENLNSYDVLFANIKPEDLDNPEKANRLIDIILQDKNNYAQLTSIDQLDDYERLHTEKCLEIIRDKEHNGMKERKDALYSLLFHLNSDQVENIVKKYGQDVFSSEIDKTKLSESDLKTLEIMSSLKKLYDADNINELCDEISKNEELIEQLKSEKISIKYPSLENLCINFYNNRLNEKVLDPNAQKLLKVEEYKGQDTEIRKPNLFQRIFLGKNEEYKKFKQFESFKSPGLTQYVKATKRQKLSDRAKNGKVYFTNIFGKTKMLGMPEDSGKGRNVKVFELDPEKEFYMLVRVEGAYNGPYKEPYDYTKEKFPLNNHGNCKSLISNSMLAIARTTENSGPIFGYSSQEKNSLLMMAPWDIASRDENKKLAPNKAKWNFNSRGIEFRLPKFMINRTRHNHNELVNDRLMFDEDSQSFKMDKPHFIIYMKESNATEEDIKKDDRYRQSFKAAAQFNVPLLIVDREKIIEHEQNKMIESIKELSEEKDIEKLTSKIPELINNFECNLVSLRFAEEMKGKYFTEDLQKKLYSGIENKIEEIRKTDPKAAKEIEKAYDKAIIDEVSKYKTNTGKPLYRVQPSNHIKNQYSIALKRQSKEFGKDHLAEYMRAISKTDLYKDNKHHSIEHIQKVMIFTNKISDDIWTMSEDSRNELLVAAAFHDCGRGKDKDGNDIHGIESAKKFKEYIENNPDNPFNIRQDQIPIIQAIIEYHEVNDQDKEKAYNDFIKICVKYGIRDGKKIDDAFLKANILKDADALDRFRFARRGQLDPNRLRNESARNNIEYAKQLNEKYAKKVLKEIYGVNEEDHPRYSNVETLGYHRIQKEKQNRDYIEEHIDVDTLIDTVYEIDDPKKEENREKDEKKEKAKKVDKELFDDLTVEDVNGLSKRLTRSAKILRSEIEEEREGE